MTKKIFSWIFIGLILIASTAPINQGYSANWLKRIQIQNFSSLQRTSIIVPIEIPKDATGNSFQIAEGSLGESLLPLYLSNSTPPTLYTQINLYPNEEKTIFLSTKKKSINKRLTPSTQSGTEFLFVNYKTAIIVSTEDQNSISFFASDGKMLNSDQKPLILGKGKWFVLQSNTPKLTRVLSEKPINIFCSTLKEFSDLDSVEPGDSDTTTLFGNDLFLFTEKHLFISAYEKTKVSLYDDNEIVVWTGTIESNHGLFQGNLKRGAYHLVADKAVTIQFGYLDDENFSVLYGKDGKINGYSFGDIMINSQFPNTQVSLQYGNEKITKKDFHFKQAGMTQIFSLIEQFTPKNPEFIFVSISFNYPIQVFTFSSGNNFGGEYIPGKNALHSDTEYSFVTLRVSKEFSKEQKNLIELIGLKNNTNVTATGAWNQKVVLQEKSNFVFLSNTPMEKVNLISDKPFQVSQIHNYNSKGLFYFVPPIYDSTIQIEITDQTSEAMIQNETIFNKNIHFLVNKKRFRDFILIILTPDFLPSTLFFSSLILLLLLILGFIWIQYIKQTSKIKPQLIESEEDIELVKNKLFENIAFEPISHENTTSSEENQYSLPDKFEYPRITLPLSGNLPKQQDKSCETKGKEKEIMVEEKTNRKDSLKSEAPSFGVVIPENENASSISKDQSSFLAKLKENKVVLDPGSANRLYIEGKLDELPHVFMVKSSSRKITTEVTDKIQKIDLNLQDVSKAIVYKDSLGTFEEAGKALALCKKQKIIYYISSYKLPSLIQGIHVIHISDALKT
jgi:hypothetical protein